MDTDEQKFAYPDINKQEDKSKIDYSLYLVTDSTPEILGGRDLVDVVQSAVTGGVTIVQYRDKTSDTAELVRVATKLHVVTKSFGIPLLINDRIDVALAVGAEGVHLGQDDMDLRTARRLLGSDAIIGASVTSPQEASKALDSGADYLGIGTVFATPTKRDAKSIIGISGARSILASLPRRIPCVCIGGINASNAQRVLFQTQHDDSDNKTSPWPLRRLSGIAVVSAIVASDVPETAAVHLSSLVHSSPPFSSFPLGGPKAELKDIIETMVKITPLVHASVASRKPLSHNMTNQVVTNFAANVAYAVGASPIMSQNGAEASDLAALKGGLVINMGTVNPDSLVNYTIAVRAYNAVGNPVVLDPVGCGATALRRQAVRDTLNAGYYDVMKGNEAEIRTVLREGAGPFSSHEDTEVAQHGVDSSAGGGGLSENAKINVVKALAKRERNIVLMTGPIDYLSDGNFVFAIGNGHKFLGEITGSGCTLGTTIAAFATEARMGGSASNSQTQERQESVRNSDLLSVFAAILTFEIAAELAVEPDPNFPGGAKTPSRVKGPGSFVPAFLDALSDLRETARTNATGLEQFYRSRAQVRSF
ncbi:MAG: hypothetical protein M1831_002180 [Alyxoria varia]|nr:MAG: hypothetical protein M1831_002180 [Alyxoria varia]